MDSGNSGNLQSSSGGEEEYESRATATTVVDSIFINTHQPPPHPLIGTFSNYTQQLHHRNPNDFNNPTAAWPDPTSTRSDPYIANPFVSSFQHSPPAATVGEDNNRNNNSGGGSATSASARNTRKRSRASRRAPTTVLSTDTTNFKEMVQEFTGVPAPPFSNPSFPRSNRLDNLLGSRSTVFDVAPSPYLLRPYAQKSQTPAPFLVSSSTNSSIPTSSDLLLNINNNQNQNPLFFSSLLHINPPKFIFSNSSAAGPKPHIQGPFEIPSDDINNGPGLNDFRLRIRGDHASATPNDLQGQISSDRAAARNDRENNTVNENVTKWRRSSDCNNDRVVREDDNDGDGYSQAQLKPVNGGYDFPGSTSSNNHGEKDPENVATARAKQGMVDSWIYSSD